MSQAVRQVNALTQRWLARQDGVGGIVPPRPADGAGTAGDPPAAAVAAPGGVSAGTGGTAPAAPDPGAAHAGGATAPGGSPTGTVLSALGVWPLLAFLAAPADEPGRTELATALGVSPDSALPAVHELLALIATIPTARMALGLWTDQRLPLEPAWVAALPAHTAERLTGDAAADQQRLDAWADRATDGLIPRFPLTVDAGTRLVLASALLVQTTWIQAFEAGSHWVGSGPWSGADGGRRISALHRSTAVLDRLAVAATPLGPVAHLTVMGTDDIDVHLVLGPETGRPGEVLAAGVDVLGGVFPALTGDRLPVGHPGPGVTVAQERSFDRHDRLHVTTVPFEVDGAHDLLAPAEVFGLSTVRDPSRGHFPGLSTVPLFVQQARQNALARFTAKGFKAAAVTAFGFAAGAAMPATPPFRVKHVSVVFDRPFAFYAVHRRSGLILAAGWVAEPGEHDIEPWQ